MCDSLVSHAKQAVTNASKGFMPFMPQHLQVLDQIDGNSCFKEILAQTMTQLQ